MYGHVADPWFVPSSYLSTLTLVRVRMEQRGSYTATVANDDEVREVVFDLQVTGQSSRQIKRTVVFRQIMVILCEMSYTAWRFFVLFYVIVHVYMYSICVCCYSYFMQYL